MSLISVLPFSDTLEYWWAATAGEPGRLRFFALKLLEVSAFLDNHRAHREQSLQTVAPTAAPARPGCALPADPKLVVVVPVYCRSALDLARLEALVQALRAQRRPAELVLVDDASPLWRDPPGCTVLRMDRNRGPAAARNRGIAQALALGADVIALTDADCRPDPGWTAALVSALQRQPRAHGMAGTTWSHDRSALGRYHERNGTLNGRRAAKADHLIYAPTCNLALTAPLARALRFDEAFAAAAAEDIDLCQRAHLDGWRIHHTAQAVVRHDFGFDRHGPIGALRLFWRNFRRYAQGECLLLAKHPGYFHSFEGSREIVARPPTDDLDAHPNPASALGSLQVPATEDLANSRAS